MKRLLFLLILFSGCSILSPLQRSKYLTLSNLIDTGKYAEAKEVVEGMIDDDQSVKWSKTWYYRGHLCQSAYQDGTKKKDKVLLELYPDQLYVAYDSYHKALFLDKSGKTEKLIAPKYVVLANEFQRIGEAHFKNKKFAEAFKSFEHALKITESPFLAIETDKSLIYNTGLSAFEAGDWDNTIKYLTQLHNQGYSTNVTHILSNAHLAKGDTAKAKKVLVEGVEKFSYHEDLVLLLTDLRYKTNETEEALNLLNRVIANQPSNYIFPYTKGLIFQKTNRYIQAIDSYTKANTIAPNELMVYVNIATCYLNIGVDIEESTRTITNNRMVQERKVKSTEAFESALKWLDKANEKIINDTEILSKINELYRTLGALDRIKE
jgi:tetratricopeptide (TPR) repeat protein